MTLGTDLDSVGDSPAAAANTQRRARLLARGMVCVPTKIFDVQFAITKVKRMN